MSYLKSKTHGAPYYKLRSLFKLKAGRSPLTNRSDRWDQLLKAFKKDLIRNAVFEEKTL